MKFIIHGRIPSKKNSKRIVMFGHRPAIISSKDYMAWHTVAMYELKSQIKGMARRIRASGPYQVEIWLWAENMRKGDMTNKAESLNDLLVDMEIIEDDNWFVVPDVVLHFMGIDKENPRAEIGISKFTRILSLPQKVVKK